MKRVKKIKTESVEDQKGEVQKLKERALRSAWQLLVDQIPSLACVADIGVEDLEATLSDSWIDEDPDGAKQWMRDRDQIVSLGFVKRETVLVPGLIYENIDTCVHRIYPHIEPRLG